MEKDFPINQVMQRYNLHFGRELLYSYDELKRLNINQDFIYTLLKTFEDEEYFNFHEYDKFSIDTIIDYIYITHQYYLSKKLLEIEQSIEILLKDYSEKHPLLPQLNVFFQDYKKKLTAHILYEEKMLLPYVKKLNAFEREKFVDNQVFEELSDFSLQFFIDSHSDTETDLFKVRNLILDYEPPTTNQTPYRILISQLHTFEKDLFLHAMIEDKVLIPRALSLEKKYI